MRQVALVCSVQTDDEVFYRKSRAVQCCCKTKGMRSGWLVSASDKRWGGKALFILKMDTSTGGRWRCYLLVLLAVGAAGLLIVTNAPATEIRTEFVTHSFTVTATMTPSSTRTATVTPSFPTVTATVTPTPVATLPPPTAAPPPRPEAVTGPCRVQHALPCSVPLTEARRRFEETYERRIWGADRRTRSGAGSTIAGAFDWVGHLTNFMKDHLIRSVADIPCGDVGWQFAVHEINEAEAYVGGDITNFTIKGNRKRFQNHLNKDFAVWDFVECGAPKWRSTCDAPDAPPRAVDLIILRDVVQHIPIQRAIKGLRKVILESGAKFIAMSSYPSIWTFPKSIAWICHDDVARRCRFFDSIREGEIYPNDFSCPPWSFPVPLFHAPSHTISSLEDKDYMAIWRVADLVPLVKKMSPSELACPSQTMV